MSRNEFHADTAALDDSDRALLDDVRAYVRDVVVPARDRLDAVTSVDGFPMDVMQPGIDLGLKALALREEDGGRAAGTPLLGRVVEALAFGDLGVAYYFKHNWRFARMIPRLPDHLRGEVARRIAEDPWYLAASAMTEEHSGSDNHVLSDDPDVGMRLSARRDGDEWVLDGTKIMITNGSMAGIYFVGCRTDRTRPVAEGVTIIAVPADTPGLRCGEPYPKLGQRASVQTDVHFDGVRVPLDHAVSEVGEGLGATRRGANVGSNLINAYMAIGVADSAYQAALEWSRTRIQGGVPLYRHQLVAHALGSMKVDLEAARGYAAQVADAIDRLGPAEIDPVVAWGTNVFASEMVVRVARSAMEQLGGRGMMGHWPTEKIMRDALTLQHGFGTNPLTLLKIGTAEAERGGWTEPV